MNRICEVCSTPFVAEGKGSTFKKYCSENCREESRKEKAKSRYNYEKKVRELVICEGCGKEFPARENQKYCSPRCWRYINCPKSEVTTEIKNCLNCNSVFEDNTFDKCKKYCSEKCQREYHKPVKICKICGKEYKTGYNNGKYCSNECWNKNKTKCVICGKLISNKKYCSKECQEKEFTITINKCIECGKEFETTNKASNYCSDKCKEIRNNRVYIRICRQCGEEFKTKNEQRYYCSKKCIKKYTNNKSKKNRDIRLKNNGEIDNSISLEKLIKRDKNICYLCGKECDSNDFVIENRNFIVGSEHPSIDHVIPIAKGGTHTWDNIKLAHIKCNTKKSDKSAVCIEDGEMKFDL